MRRRQLLFQVVPLRAIAEAAALGAILWFALWCAHGLLAPAIFPPGVNRFSPGALTILLGMVVSLLCSCFYAVRARYVEGRGCMPFVIEALAIAVLTGILSVMELLFALAIFHTVPPAQRTGGEFVPAEVAAVTFLLNGALLVTLRAGICILRYWNHLRRTQLIWALTHAHLMVVLLGAAMLVALLTFVVIVSGKTDITVIIPTVIGILVLTVVALAFVLPPSALFSYVVMRRTTSRLRALAEATGALRKGHYAVRVHVVGEDEVAQLQENFNAMAADLERTVRALHEERDRVAGLLQARRELIANVSHELRTPIATTRGYLETTLTHWSEQPPETLHNDLQIMEGEIIRLQHLVEDLFDLSRAEVGRLIIQCKPVDVGQIVRGIVTIAAPLVWRSSKIELAAGIPESVPEVSADPARLEQALHNLLHNAVRHTPPGGIIIMGVSVEPGAVTIQVKDTGEGIDPVDLPHIWERFYQTQPARAGASGGAGLGLALVKEWIEAMGGMVSSQSVLGEGSCFTMRLLRADCQPSVDDISQVKKA